MLNYIRVKSTLNKFQFQLQKQEKVSSNTRFYISGQRTTENKLQCDFGKAETQIGKGEKNMLMYQQELPQQAIFVFSGFSASKLIREIFVQAKRVKNALIIFSKTCFPAYTNFKDVGLTPSFLTPNVNRH